MHVSGKQLQPTSRLVTPPALAIGKGFKGKFGGQDKPKEEPLVKPYSPDILAKLRTRRKMLKELARKDPQQVYDMMYIHKGLTFFEALALARREKRLIVSNFVHDGVLNNTNVEYWVRTGTMIIYEAPNQPFGEFVVFEGLRFAVPIQFRGLKNCALAVEHPDFDVKPNGELVVPDQRRIHLIKKFPVEFSWYSVHAETGIPHGRQEATNESARRLFRSNSSYVGLLVRLGDYYDGRSVVAVCRASDRIGVALV